VLWLSLCSGLVVKHHDLILVFYAFCGSFALAALLRLLHSALSFAWGGEGAHHRQIRNLVGSIACSAAVGCLLAACVAQSREMRTSSQCTAADGGGSPGGRADYVALSIVAGYLAFDHWYSALHRCQDCLLGVAEDALTLIFSLVLLATQSKLDGFRTGMFSWLLYKILRLSLRMLLATSCSAVRNEMKVAGEKSHALKEKPLMLPVPLSEAVIAKSLGAVGEKICAGTVKNDPSSFWTIRGVRYDLTDYVRHHPGGREAIMLGHGRECTALFQSYHPFTARHLQVLRKYRVGDDSASSKKVDDALADNDAIAVSELPSGRDDDPFYRVLCDRVARRLREEGVDPVKDRAATWPRTLYYALVASALGLSAVSHCRVSIR